MPTSDTPQSRLGMRRLSVDIGTTLVRRFLGVLLSLSTSAIIARTLGPSGNGQYVVAMLLPVFLMTFLNLGISPANVFYVGRRSVTPSLAFRVSVQIWFVLTILGVALGTLSILFLGESWFPNVPPILLWLALVYFPLGLLQAYLLSLMQAVQDFRSYNVAVIAAPAIMLFLVVGFFLAGGGITAVIFAAVLSQLANLVITYSLVRSKILKRSEKSVDIERHSYARNAIRYGYKAHLSNILAFVNYRADIFLVNLLLNPAAAGSYVIAVSMSEKLWLLSEAVSTVILPRLSELHGEEEVRRQLTPLLARWVTIFTAIGASILALLAPYLLGLIFGALYMNAVTPLLYLLPGIVAATLTAVLANDIAARGRPEINMYTSFVVITINIIGNLFLIPLWGLSGAAIATTVAYSVQVLLLASTYCWLSKNHWSVLFTFGAQDISILKQLRRRVYNRIKS